MRIRDSISNYEVTSGVKVNYELRNCIRTSSPPTGFLANVAKFRTKWRHRQRNSYILTRTQLMCKICLFLRKIIDGFLRYELPNYIKKEDITKKPGITEFFCLIAGAGLERCDLRVMSPTSYQLLHPASKGSPYITNSGSSGKGLNELFQNMPGCHKVIDSADESDCGN